MSRLESCILIVTCLLFILAGFRLGIHWQQHLDKGFEQKLLAEQSKWKPKNLILMTPSDQDPDSKVWNTHTIPLNQHGYFSWYMFKPTSYLMVYVE